MFFSAKGNNKKIIGKTGETIASNYLIKKGYKIVERNYAKKYGEIDLIAKAPDKTLIFVEVKTFSGNIDSKKGLIPEDNFTAEKRNKLNRIVRMFVNHYPRLVDETKGWRIDLITIGLKMETRIATLKHYENV